MDLRTRLVSLAMLLRDSKNIPRENRVEMWRDIRAGLSEADVLARFPALQRVNISDRQRQIWWEESGTAEFQKKLELASSWEGGTRHCLLLGDEAYPPRLLQLADPPLALWCEGNLARLAQPQIAIVGSRKATRSGLRLAARFACDLGDAGFCITSGLATGIDGAAHAACVNTGLHTIGVLGCGPDQTYPRIHTELRGKMVESGCVISEYPPGVPPLAYHFPERNRLISALSVAVLVVEADRKSGSLITARCALEQGREVFAVPGSPLSNVSAGCHQLIREGAPLVETANDLVNGLPEWAHPQVLREALAEEQSLPPDLTELEKRILEQLDTNPLPLDRLLKLTGAPVTAFSQTLIELELKQLIAREGGGVVRFYS